MGYARVGERIFPEKSYIEAMFVFIGCDEELQRLGSNSLIWSDDVRKSTHKVTKD